jgi:hypothetical protein
MNKHELEDLKQFITGRFDEIDKRFDKMDQKIDNLDKSLSYRITRLEKKVDDGFAGVGEALTQMNDEHDKAHNVINRRLLLLEQTRTA